MKSLHFFGAIGALLTLPGVSHCIAQSVPPEIYLAYDKQTGIENSWLNNGKAHVNPFRIRNDNHNYYKTPEFLPATVQYDGQPYFEQLAKYDINRDILVLKTTGEHSYLGVELAKPFVDAFTIDGKRFVNLDKIERTPDFVSGYHEVGYEGKNLTLYVKHQKIRRQRDGGQLTTDDFKDEPHFIIKTRGEFFLADSRKTLIEVFPDQKKRISEMYQKDRKLEKSDRIKFMNSLARQIDSFINTESK